MYTQYLKEHHYQINFTDSFRQARSPSMPYCSVVGCQQLEAKCTCWCLFPFCHVYESDYRSLSQYLAFADGLQAVSIFFFSPLLPTSAARGMCVKIKRATVTNKKTNKQVERGCVKQCGIESFTSVFFIRTSSIALCRIVNVDFYKKYCFDNNNMVPLQM